MKTADIKKLIALLEQSSISEIEVGHWGKRIRVSRTTNGVVAHTPDTNIQPPSPMPANEPDQQDEQPDEVSVKGVAVKSPMVGTFYRSPSPESEAFIKVGDRVTKGDTLCIIEAMKIMNEVEAEISGVVLDIQVDNAQPVEYNQTLFIIEP